MEKLEKAFTAIFEKNMLRTKDGNWYYKKDVMKNVCNKKSAIEFKLKYPYVFNEFYNQWFDEVHPY